MKTSTRAYLKPGIGLLLFWAVAAWAQGGGVDYQDRGDRFEGRQWHPVGGTEIELMGATIDNRASSAGLPETLSLNFYLQDPAEVRVVVREREPKKEYWLDKVKPAKPWMPRQINRFFWPANAALRELKLEVTELTALVRLGYAEPKITEFVAPAQLSSTESPFLPGDYRFTFRTSRPAELEVRFSGCPGKVVPSRLQTGSRMPFDITVQSIGTSSGRCHLELTGSMENVTKILQIVEFFSIPEGLRGR